MKLTYGNKRTNELTALWTVTSSLLLTDFTSQLGALEKDVQGNDSRACGAEPRRSHRRAARLRDLPGRVQRRCSGLLQCCRCGFWHCDSGYCYRSRYHWLQFCAGNLYGSLCCSWLLADAMSGEHRKVSIAQVIFWSLSFVD